MIILDLQQVMLSNLLVSLGHMHTSVKIEENLLRHMILNSIRSNISKFKNHGKLVIACDSREYWRRNVFPYYKAHRKKNRDKIDLDWSKVFEILGAVKNELKEYFPYPTVEVTGAEADDIIAVLCRHTTEPTLILSADKDFVQLHNKLVTQYDPIKKKAVKSDNPQTYLKEHVLRGDAGDGIPNVLSDDNCFVLGERQKPLTQKKLVELLSKEDTILNSLKNYHRNKQLIDFTMIPADIEAAILQEFENQSDKDRSKLMTYFIKFKLKNLMSSLSDF